MAKLSYEFDPFTLAEVEVPSDKRDEALEAVADLIKEQVLLYIGEGSSPVEGGPWKRRLSKEYKKRKSEDSSVDYANLELSGDLLDSLNVAIKGKKLSLEVSGGSDVVGKADGNNRGTYGRTERTDNSKSRRFIPIGKETLKSEIIDQVRTLLEEDYGVSEN